MSETDSDEDDPIRLTAETVGDFAAQDWLLILEALATCVGPPLDGLSAILRSVCPRAGELVDTIVRELDLPPEEMPAQIDDGWHGSPSPYCYKP